MAEAPSAADVIWDRFCDPDAPTTYPGDAAMVAVLLCHGMAMNGGLLQACEALEPDQRAAAVAGFRLLGLDDAAEAVAEVARRADALAGDLGEAGEQLEEEADRLYRAALAEGDETIDRAFRSHLERNPEAYAPIGG
ncbi:hypothetical protein [Modestobacter sp. SSW1-42]|uniref:DMP19 family protein n=1 Tax=Modestobacter sp. SSW1-42 TaxID=596372 RepID=UPI00398673AC